MPASATFGALRHAAYRRVWGAELVSRVGDWMQITGRAYLVYAITGSTAALGAIYFFTYIPQLLLSPVSGVLADRLDRRRLLLASQFVATAGAVGMGVLAWSGAATLANVSAISFALGVEMTLAGPAGSALVPALVPREDLSSAVSLESATNSATRIAGPLLAGLVIPVWGVAWVFFLNAVSFAGVIIVWATTLLPRQPPMEETRTLRAIGAGVRFVRDTPGVAVPIAVVAFLSAVGLVYQPLGVAYATRVLAHGDHALGAREFGLLQAAIGLGAVVGILGVSGVGRRRPAATLWVTAVGFSILLVALGATSYAPLALAVATGLGAFHFANATLALNLVQHQTPEVVRGRVLSLHLIAWVGVFPVTALAAGALAGHIGVPATLVGAGSACLAFCAVLARWIRLVPRGELAVELGTEAELALVGAVPDEER